MKTKYVIFLCLISLHVSCGRDEGEESTPATANMETVCPADQTDAEALELAPIESLKEAAKDSGESMRQYLLDCGESLEEEESEEEY